MEYLTKNELKPYKEEIMGIIHDLKEELGNEWNIYYYLVGSGRRNMVVNSNEGFDLDYHIMLRNYPNGMSAKDIKMHIMDALNNIIPEHLSNSKDSTHVITIKCIEDGRLKYSYDLAIMKKAEYSEILKNEKEDGSNGPYHFVQVPESNNFVSKLSNIKGPEMWNDLREIYLSKKEIQHQTKKENRIYSFALFQEAINEVLQKEY